MQSLSIEACLTGANVIVLAPTAGGKTEAAFFPVISQMLAAGWDGLSVLYVSPIRALLNNQEQRLQRYFELVGRRAVCWHGDTSQGNRRQIIADSPDCLLTTPESLEAILVSSKIDHCEFFKNVQAVVIDELHAFAGDDRGWHLLSVLARIQRLAGSVTLDATIAPDGAVRDVKAISGPSALAPAAIAAVRQWRYSPPLLNGARIEVHKEITIVFKLP